MTRSDLNGIIRECILEVYADITDGDKVRGYVAVVLDEHSRNKLLKMIPPTHSKVVAHHVTLSFNPSKRVFADRYADMIGNRVVIRVEGVADDDLAQAALVSGVESENSKPHITLSLESGIPAKYSNELLSVGNIKTVKFELIGDIRLIPFK